MDGVNIFWPLSERKRQVWRLFLKSHKVLQKSSLDFNFSALLMLTTITRNSIPQYAGMTEKTFQYNSFYPHSMI